jgi:uncharacterized protein YcnI
VGQELPFKVTQLCGDKGKVSWDEVAAAGVDPHSIPARKHGIPSALP